MICRHFGLPEQAGHTKRTHASFLKTPDRAAALSQVPVAHVAAIMQAARSDKDGSQFGLTYGPTRADRECERGHGRTHGHGEDGGGGQTGEGEGGGSAAAETLHRAAKCPPRFARRVGDRIRNGWDNGRHGRWGADPRAPTWHPHATTPSALVSSSRLLDMVLGPRVQQATRATLAKVRGAIPHINLGDECQCLHANFSAQLVAAILAPMNRALTDDGCHVVTPREFMQWLAVYLVRTTGSLTHQDVGVWLTEFPRAAANMMSESRFRAIHRRLLVVPAGESRSALVRACIVGVRAVTYR